MTRGEEIGCDDCFKKLHKFAELELAGKYPEKSLSLVKEHLDRCVSCREEYEALLEALKHLPVYRRLKR